MVGYRSIVWIVSVAVAAAVGWAARAPTPPAATVHAAAATRPLASSPLADSTPLIAAASDGNVTLRVEQQPLEWVLEQITLQGGHAELPPRAQPAVHVARLPPDCPQPASPRADAEALLLTLERGSDAERFDGLMRARSDGVLLPQQTLERLYRTDASERVRVAAFESYLEQSADRPHELRRALEAALLVASPAVQREAQQRLDEIHELARIDALAAEGVP